MIIETNDQQTVWLKELLLDLTIQHGKGITPLSQKDLMIIDQLSGKLMTDFEEPEGYPDKFLSEQEQSLEDNLK